MSRARQFVIAACGSALALGFIACATADGTVGDLDAGQDQEAGGQNPTPDSGPKPPKPDAGTNGGDTDSGQLGDPDGGGTCVKAPPSKKCGVAPQCGCAPTETCDVQDNAGNVDCISAGTAGPGKACTTTAGCALGSTCISNVCKPYCPGGVSVDSGACGLPGTGNCLAIVDNSDKPIPNLNLCRIACDITNPTSCDVPNALPNITVGCNPDSTNQTDCFPAGTSTTSCAGSTLCAPAYGCITVTVNDAGSDVCKKWCKVGKASPTCGGADCPSFSGSKLIIAGVEYGACP